MLAWPHDSSFKVNKFLQDSFTPSIPNIQVIQCLASWHQPHLTKEKKGKLLRSWNFMKMSLKRMLTMQKRYRKQ